MFKGRGLLDNKKAQEGITIGTLLLIVLGAVVVVVIILGATGGLNFVFSKINLVPGQDLQAVVSSCEVAALNGLKADYCGYKQAKIDNVKQYVNCEDTRIKDSMSAEAQTKATELTCETEEANSYCQTLFSQGKVESTTRVNNVLCASLSCVQLGGDIIPEPEDKTKDCGPSKKPIFKANTYSDYDSKNVCCVDP